MRKTDFFIVGAAKSGTTSLYHYLEQHPDVFMSQIKETNYFTHQVISDQNLYYETDNIQTEEDYLNLFANQNEKVVGEASVSYLFYPETAKKIHDFNPNAKIIIILRNPVDRAFSHYSMDNRLGFINDSFEKVINKECNNGKCELYYQQHIELGNYYDQVKRYIDTFGADQVKILFSEDTRSNASSVLEEVFEFLDVDKTFEPNLDVKHNAQLSLGKVSGRFYKSKRIRSIAKALVPSSVRSKVKKAMSSNAPKETLPTELRTRLKEYYKSDIEKLETLLNKKLNHWYE